MIALHYKRGTDQYVGLVYTGTHLAHAVDGHAFGVVLASGARQIDVVDQQLEGIVKSTQKTTPCPPQFGPALAALWG